MLNLWELQSGNVEAAQNASNVLIILFAICCYIKDKGCIFAAFFIDELLTNMSFIDGLPEYQYYLLVAAIYSFLYWYLERNNVKFKTLIACGIIVFFYFGMMVDATVNADNESFLYQAYLPIAIFVYLYLIYSLFEWERIRTNLGQFINSLVRTFRTSDLITFTWYNIKHIKTYQK